MTTPSDTPKTAVALELSRDKYELAVHMSGLERALAAANEHLAALREEREVLRSQVENADVNLAQVRLNTKADRDRLAAVLETISELAYEAADNRTTTDGLRAELRGVSELAHAAVREELKAPQP